MVEERGCVGREVKKETMADDFTDVKPMIPGLDPHAEVKSVDDKNLAPFSLTYPKTLQYGDTTFISISTNHPDWAPGECLNLHKHEGNFKVKTSGTTQQVNYLVQSDNFNAVTLRTPTGPKQQRQESCWLERGGRPITRERRKMNRRRGGSSSQLIHCQ